jgi:catechol 2,3-dioxygenase-like lactoylglutathione lyase family enzyme
VSVTFSAAVPVFQATNVGRTIEFWRTLGFEVGHRDEESFGIMTRDSVHVILTAAVDESWRARTDWARPVCSGAESFLAGTGSCRIEVTGVDELYGRCAGVAVVHPNGTIHDTPWGTREFGALDPDGNLVTFFEERSE